MMGIMILMGLFTIHIPRLFPHGNEWWMELIAGAMFIVILTFVILIVKKPRHKASTRNSIPCVPFLPICAIWMDIHLIICLPYSSWLAALVWALLGIFIYMSYSVWHSKEGVHITDCEDLHGFDLNSCDEDDDIINCVEEVTDGSTL
ncbi:cationic amino acid transporter-like protein, partial [Dinothrombium tinctorium]